MSDDVKQEASGSVLETSTTNTVTGTNGAGITTSLETTAPSWFDNLSEELRNEPSLQNLKTKDLNDLAKSFVHAQKEIGSRIRIPSNAASPEAKKEFFDKITQVPGILKMPDPQNKEEVNAFLSKMGRPASPDGYKLELPKELESNESIKQQVDLFKQEAHKIGLNNEQVKALANMELQKTASVMQAMAQEKTNTINSLKQTWGNEYDNRLALVGETLRHFEGKFPNEVKALLTTSIGNNPVFHIMAAELGRMYRESGAIKGEHLAKGGLTPEEARERINEINANREHPASPLFKGKIPERVRQEALSEKNKLYEALGLPKTE